MEEKIREIRMCLKAAKSGDRIIFIVPRRVKQSFEPGKRYIVIVRGPLDC